MVLLVLYSHNSAYVHSQFTMSRGCYKAVKPCQWLSPVYDKVVMTYYIISCTMYVVQTTMVLILSISRIQYTGIDTVLLMNGSEHIHWPTMYMYV